MDRTGRGRNRKALWRGGQVLEQCGTEWGLWKVRDKLLRRWRGEVDRDIPGAGRSVSGGARLGEPGPAWLECGMDEGRRTPVLGRVLLMTGNKSPTHAPLGESGKKWLEFPWGRGTEKPKNKKMALCGGGMCCGYPVYVSVGLSEW